MIFICSYYYKEPVMRKNWIFIFILLFLALPAEIQAQKNWIKVIKNLTNGKEFSSFFVQKNKMPFYFSHNNGLPIKALPPAAAQDIAQKIIANSRISQKNPYALLPFENYIHHFLFTASVPGKNPANLGTGFVVAENTGGKTVLWGVIFPHIFVEGNIIEVSFHVGKQKYSYPAEVVIKGADAFLVKLPPQIAEFARPLPLAEEAMQPGDLFFSYGFDKGKLVKMVGHIQQKNLGRRPELDLIFSPDSPSNLYSGIILNKRGEATALVSEYRFPLHLKALPSERPFQAHFFFPTSHIKDLLREYKQPGTGSRIMVFNGIQIGRLGIDEKIIQISVYYEKGRASHLSTDQSTLLRHTDLMHLEKWFLTKNAVCVRVCTNKYTYFANLHTHSATKISHKKK